MTYVRFTHISRNEVTQIADQGGDTRDTKRLHVVFSSEQFEKLQNIANSQKISLSDALRQAISLSSLIARGSG